MTEQMLDGNLDSWRDYAYNLLNLIRRQILQGTFAPLLSVISGTLNKGIASFLDDDDEAQRQDAGIQQAGATAWDMLGNGFYRLFGGALLRGNRPVAKAPTPQQIQAQNPNLIGEDTPIDQLASNETMTSWWGSFTSSFSEGFGSLWSSTKEVFSWMGNGISSLADGFMELCGSPIEWLKNAFTSAANVIVEFIASLTANSSANAVTSVLTSVIGAVGGGIAGSIGSSATAFAGGSAGQTGVSMGGAGGVGIKVANANNLGWYAPTSFNANGGIVTSNGEIDLRKYARGGIANSPQLAVFGEGSMPEAFVPLPDGRSIPVSFRGTGVGESVGGNNISIVINVSNTNNGSSETQTSDATQAGKDSSDMAKLANRIKSLVRQEIVTQSRPGGLLAGA